MGARLRWQYVRVVLATSLVWVLIDAFLLMYFTDCSSSNGTNCNQGGDGNINKLIQTTKGASILKRILPDILNPSKAGPGDMGKPVVIPKDREHEMKEKFKINQFNLLASEMIALNRTLPDVRMPQCRGKTYPVSDLPSTSVIIVFHNEAWSTLLRTVHSVIGRSPRRLLTEILLVDDASERDFLGRQLEEYVATLPVPTQVIRMPSRTGLIRARLKGAEISKGQVLTFLDAHCECTQGWLEPLLYEIHKNRSSVVCPIIDVISDDTFEYITGSDMTWGGFNWKLNFRWYPVPQRETERRGGDRTQPLRSPTMAGGLFAISREYFYDIGSYDSGMDIWGGENLEMSFRVWQCGGQVLIATCARVGHVFRKVSPYTWPGGVVRILNHNTQRTVEVWMDEYKDFYYKISPGVKDTAIGDISERLELRKKLQCKSFRWYLENIYPESQMPLDYFSLGEVRNQETGKCLDTMGRKQGDKVGLIKCHSMGGNQVFSYTIRHEVMSDDLCLDVSARGGPLRLIKCHKNKGNQQWAYTKQTLALRHVNSNQCLDRATPQEADAPSLSPCSGSESQKWALSDMNWAKFSAYS